jgi:hypothetical protein
MFRDSVVEQNYVDAMVKRLFLRKPSALPFQSKRKILLAEAAYGELNAISNAIDYAKFYSRSHDAVIRVYGEGWQCDRDARARGRFQRVKSRFLAVSLAEIEGCIGRPTPLKLLTVNHAMRTLV